jgi:hypothetical protein
MIYIHIYTYTHTLNTHTHTCRQPVFGEAVECPAFEAAFEKACARLLDGGVIGMPKP